MNQTIQAFIDVICEHPRKLAHRLILADYLEENFAGDPETLSRSLRLREGLKPTIKIRLPTFSGQTITFANNDWLPVLIDGRNMVVIGPFTSCQLITRDHAWHIAFSEPILKDESKPIHRITHQFIPAPHGFYDVIKSWE